MAYLDLLEVPPHSIVLLAGPPGAGKSTLARDVILHHALNLKAPTLFVATETDPSRVEEDLVRQEPTFASSAGLVSYVDGYHETVGLATWERSLASACCHNLNELSIAIFRALSEVGGKEVLVVLDSLTPLYLLCEATVLRFVQSTLNRVADQGHKVVACIDEGIGRQEDLTAMMSLANGVVKIEAAEQERTLNVVKFPGVQPGRVPFRTLGGLPSPSLEESADPYVRRFVEQAHDPKRRRWRTNLEDKVSILWLQFAVWGGLLWDPKRFPALTYNVAKEAAREGTKTFFKNLSWHRKLLVKALVRRPDVKMLKMFENVLEEMNRLEGNCLLEYLDEISRDDEHHFEKRESAICWGFPNVGAALCFHDAGELAGELTGAAEALGGSEQDWNAVEYSCLGGGKTVCKVKVVPERPPELRDFLNGVDGDMIERVNKRILDHLLPGGAPMTARPTLRNYVDLHEFQEYTSFVALMDERYQVAMRMAGVNAGKTLGEHLMGQGSREDEAEKHMLGLLQSCKVGLPTVAETIRILDNCESAGARTKKPICFFTTGFLNGFYTAVKNEKVKELSCAAAGDRICEWGFI